MSAALLPGVDNLLDVRFGRPAGLLVRLTLQTARPRTGIVLCPGLGQLDEKMLEVVAPLSEVADVAVLATPGGPYAPGAPVRGDRGVEALAAAHKGLILRLAGERRWEHVIMGGLSLGAAVSICLASWLAETLRKAGVATLRLALFGVPLGPLPWELSAARRPLDGVLGRIVARSLPFRALAIRRISKKHTPFEMARDHGRLPQEAALLAPIVAESRDLDAASLIGNLLHAVQSRLVHSPIVVATGEDDRWFPAARTEGTLKRLANQVTLVQPHDPFRFVRVKGAGHSVFDDAPEDALKIIRGQIEETGP